MNYGYNNWNGGRSRRRRRQRMMKTVVLSVIVAVLVIGAVIFLFSLKRAEKNAKHDENESGSVTETLPPETEPEDTALGALREGFFTKEYSGEDLHTGDLILVRAGAPYSFPEDQKLKDLYSGRRKYSNGARAYQISTTDLYLEASVLEKLNGLAEEFYEKTGERGLLVKSAYRTYEDQKELYDYRVQRDGEEKAAQYVAKAGESEHHTAMAFDMSVYKDGVNTYISDEEEYLWIYENAHRYGFVLRYPESKAEITGIAYEAWHFRYVGAPHAYYMYKEGLVLEEYLELLMTEHLYNESHLKVDCDDGNSYEIYYVTADDYGNAEIILPTGYEYSVSGDNVGGYIVTVLLGETK